MRHETLSAKQKAAVMLMALGPEASAEVIRHLDEDEIEALTLEVAQLDRVQDSQRDAAIAEFCRQADVQPIHRGGMGSARTVLTKAFGTARADDLVQKVTTAIEDEPFGFLRKADPSRVASALKEENPQAIALALSQMPVQAAAAILSHFDPDFRVDVATRIATLESVTPETLKAVEEHFESEFGALLQREAIQAGGPQRLVELLSRVDLATERMIVEALEGQKPELAEQVKSMLFTFDDIVQLDDRAVQAVVKEIDIRELATALKGTKAAVQDKIFHCMSERAVTMIKEDMEFMGPTRLKTIEEAQKRIVGIIRRLEEVGEIQLGRGGEDVIV